MLAPYYILSLRGEDAIDAIQPVHQMSQKSHCCSAYNSPRIVIISPTALAAVTNGRAVLQRQPAHELCFGRSWSGSDRRTTAMLRAIGSSARPIAYLLEHFDNPRYHPFKRRVFRGKRAGSRRGREICSASRLNRPPLSACQYRTDPIQNDVFLQRSPSIHRGL